MKVTQPAEICRNAQTKSHREKSYVSDQRIFRSAGASKPPCRGHCYSLFEPCRCLPRVLIRLLSPLDNRGPWRPLISQAGLSCNTTQVYLYEPIKLIPPFFICVYKVTVCILYSQKYTKNINIWQKQIAKIDRSVIRLQNELHIKSGWLKIRHLP